VCEELPGSAVGVGRVRAGDATSDARFVDNARFPGGAPLPRVADKRSQAAIRPDGP